MKSGFTLIELLVVISIIGILASISLTSLDGGTTAAYDASAKLVLSQLQSAGVLYGATNNNNYSSFCAGSDIREILNEVTYQLNRGTAGTFTFGSRLINSSAEFNASPVFCIDNADKWAVVVKLTSGKYYCIDSEGRPQEGTLATVADLSGTGTNTNIGVTAMCN